MVSPTNIRLAVAGGAELQVYGNSALNASGIPQELAWGVGATHMLNNHFTLLLQAGHSMMGNNDLNIYVGILIPLSR